jgi:hypothetical protein
MKTKERNIDTYSKEELKEEVLYLRFDQADDHHYADEAQKESLLFQSHLFAKNLMSLGDILKFNSTNTYRDSDRKVNDDITVRHLSAMVHALYYEVQALELYIEGEDRESSIRAQMQRNGLTRAEAEQSLDDWKNKQQGNELDKSPAAISLKEMVAQKKEASK